MKSSNGPILTAVVLAIMALSVGNVCAETGSCRQVVYENDFEKTVGREWSQRTIEYTPKDGRRFLGQFCNDTVQLSFNNLPAHSKVTVCFDLFIIRKWDGNYRQYGPDFWGLSVTNGATLLHTTFSNSKNYQAYPDVRADGNYPPHTGADEINTLGYEWRGTPTDSVYKLSFSFSHTGNRLQLNFSASGLERLPNESWGLDNVKVTVQAEEVAWATANEFTVSAATHHQGNPLATGLQVRRGQKIVFVPNKEDRWHPGRGDWCDYRGQYPSANAPNQRMHFRVGKTYFGITSGVEYLAPEDGEIMLYCWDQRPDNNRGSIRVKIITEQTDMCPEFPKDRTIYVDAIQNCLGPYGGNYYHIRVKRNTVYEISIESGEAVFNTKDGAKMSNLGVMFVEPPRKMTIKPIGHAKKTYVTTEGNLYFFFVDDARLNRGGFNVKIKEVNK